MPVHFTVEVCHQEHVLLVIFSMSESIASVTSHGVNEQVAGGLMTTHRPSVVSLHLSFCIFIIAVVPVTVTVQCVHTTIGFHVVHISNGL